MSIKIVPYKMGSASAVALSEALKIKRVNREVGKNVNASLVINWGCSYIDRLFYWKDDVVNVLNYPEDIANASCKLATLSILKDKGVVTPDWSESREEASKWLAEGVAVVCRTKLNGHSGDGIVIASKQEEIVDAPLYTKYVMKKHEYRIHVFNGKVIFQQRKARKKEVADDKINWKVRNLAGGFIYANQDVNADDACKQLAIDAVAALELHFGAVDIIWNEKQNKYYVLEINTAPGLTGSTLDAYVEAFREVI